MNSHSLSPPVFPFPWASEWGEDQFGLWMVLQVDSARYIFRWIEPGTFNMGSPESEEGRRDVEDLHKVHLSKGFWIGETTVTQAFWQAIMSGNPSYFKGAALPVENVSWHDAKAFIKKLDGLHPELNTRLPWEAEWEYACRAGTETAYSFAGEIDLSKVNYRGTWDSYEEWREKAKRKTAPVRSYPANAWGFFEMHGNVYEWCEDLWQKSLGTEPTIDPFVYSAGRVESGGEDGAHRVLRGGSWFDFGRGMRSAFRFWRSPDRRNYYVGFRLVQGPGAQGGGATK